MFCCSSGGGGNGEQTTNVPEETKKKSERRKDKENSALETSEDEAMDVQGRILYRNYYFIILDFIL